MKDVAPRVHTSTYRLQLNAGFTFADVEAILPYLSSLGVGACYLSPPFTAKPGSTHGYDVSNHNEISPELGGEVAFRSLAAALAAGGMGLVLDFVPNHMGVDPTTNEWWRDVLENGPSSPFSHYFDIDWDPLKPELKNRLLLPILGEQYGDALESGKLQLAFDAGALVVAYNALKLPINPRRVPMVLEGALGELQTTLDEGDPHLREFLSVLTALRNLPSYVERDQARIAERQREKEVARERLSRLVDASEAIRKYVAESVTSFNGTVGNLESFRPLHDLLELQPYRIASWKTASDEINYRRFFDINDLAGLRVETPEVFDTIHRLVLRFIDEGLVTGLRIDHIDGLLDPAGYLRRLQEVTAPSGPPFYVVVEKILSGPEALPNQWAVAGTTGYNFLNDVNGLFINTRHGAAMARLYTRLTGRTEDLADVIYNAKRLIIGTAMTSEFQVIANAANRLSERDWRSRDFTFGSIRRTLREILACFPVYRTYVSRDGASAADRAVVDSAIRAAQVLNPATEPSIFAFLRTVLLPDGVSPASEDPEAAARFDERFSVAERFQQFSSPVQAKGVEDTASYQHVALLSLNEVGGDLEQFGRPLELFHERNADRSARWPLEMTTTGTHDTKRGEDARARLNVLSEMPSAWREAVSSWMRLNRRLRKTVGGEPAPDPNDEYHFYQALLAVWPPNQDAARPDVSPALVERLEGYMLKAIREAKVHTSWVNPNPDYESAVVRFVQRTLAAGESARFLDAFAPFAARIARLGAINALAQLALKLTAPGIPDVYQGSELWDLTLVDPDNRRPVDFPARRTALDQLEPLLARVTANAVERGHDDGSQLRELLDNWPDARIKLFVTALGLRLRVARPGLFLEGTYVPITAVGERREHVVAFAREAGADLLLVAVPRFVTALEGDTTLWPRDRVRWGDTRLPLRPEWHGRTFRNLLTGEPVSPAPVAEGHTLGAADLLDRFPVAFLIADPPAQEH